MSSLRRTAFGKVPAKDWNDGRWQLKHRITSLEALERVLPLSDSERAGVAAAEARGGFEWGITPYYLSLIDDADPRDPVRLQCIPQGDEARREAHDLTDPLGEDPKMPVPGIVHRYPDRVLLLLTDRCTVYCRFCTRKRLVGTEERQLRDDELDRVVDYLRAHREVREVILSGGDPLVTGDRYLESVLTRLRTVPHLELLRVHTRMPVVCPQRITPSLTRVLRRFQPLYLVTHFNHPWEITPDASRALSRLADAGIPLANQSVLLAGVNTDAVILEALCRALLKNRVRPYYLHQGDQAYGTEHFRTALSTGVDLVDALRGRLSGLGIPALIVDLPGGRGKVQVTADRLASTNGRTLTFRAPLGGHAQYVEGAPQPDALVCSTSDAVAAEFGIVRAPAIPAATNLVTLRGRR